MPITRDIEDYCEAAIDGDKIEFVEDGTVSQRTRQQLSVEMKKQAWITDKKVPGGVPYSVNIDQIGDQVSDIAGGSTSINYNMRETFNYFLDKWRAETALYSSVDDITNNPWYQRIVGMGEKAIPFILKSLQKDPSLISYALFDITDNNPVFPEDHGDIEAIAETWVEWGRRNGYL